MTLIGNKNNKDLYNNLLGDLVPKNIEIYIEPFGGEFGFYELLNPKPPVAIYNDININLYNEIKNKHKNVLYLNRDYKDIIKQYNSEYSFFFIDPPYYKKEYYYENHNFLTKEDHIELSNIIKGIKGKFILCYQDRPLMRELYKDFNVYKYTGNNYMSKPEIAITNY